METLTLMVKDQPLDLAELESLQVQWLAKQAEAQAEAARLQGLLGRGIILGGSDDVRPALADAQNTVQESQLVLAEISKWIQPARAVQLQRQAAQLQKQAAEATRQAEQLEAEVATHLLAIQALEGVMYVKPAPSPINGAGLAKSSELRRKAFHLTEQASDKDLSAGEILSKLKTNGGG